MSRVRLRAWRPLCDSLALKWFWPGRRDTILPFRVILSLFVNDLFDFILVYFFFPARSMTAERPLGLFEIASAILYSSGMIFRNLSSLSLRKANSIYL